MLLIYKVSTISNAFISVIGVVKKWADLYFVLYYFIETLYF